MRTIYFLPVTAAGPTVVLLALFMCDPQVSPFRGLFTLLHMQQIVDVIQPNHLPLLFMLLGFFVGAGGWIAILYGGLQGISRELFHNKLIQVHRSPPPHRFACSEERRWMNLDLFS